MFRLASLHLPWFSPALMFLPIATRAEKKHSKNDAIFIKGRRSAVSLLFFIFRPFLRRMSAENQSAKHQKILRVSHEL